MCQCYHCDVVFLSKGHRCFGNAPRIMRLRHQGGHTRKPEKLSRSVLRFWQAVGVERFCFHAITSAAELFPSP